VFASLFSCQRTELPIPSGRPPKSWRTIKNPASSAGCLRPEVSGRRNSKLEWFYPVFVSNLTP